MNNNNVTAEITGRGTTSTVPDNAGAVDAEIAIGDVTLGEVTLLPQEWDGELQTWGSLDHWACHKVREWITDDDGEVIAERVDAIVEAVRSAAG